MEAACYYLFLQLRLSIHPPWSGSFDAVFLVLRLNHRLSFLGAQSETFDARLVFSFTFFSPSYQKPALASVPIKDARCIRTLCRPHNPPFFPAPLLFQGVRPQATPMEGGTITSFPGRPILRPLVSPCFGLVQGCPRISDQRPALEACLEDLPSTSPTIIAFTPLPRRTDLHC